MVGQQCFSSSLLCAVLRSSYILETWEVSLCSGKESTFNVFKILKQTFHELTSMEAVQLKEEKFQVRVEVFKIMFFSSQMTMVGGCFFLQNQSFQTVDGA